MSQIILDFGSGNSCLNDKAIITRMYDELAKVDTKKHTIICKWQLFKEAGENVPLTHKAFDYAYDYGRGLGYQVTASVFDMDSLRFLIQYDVPFVKIANKQSLDYLIGETPRKVQVYKSVGSREEILSHDDDNYRLLCCVSEYPADVKKYKTFRGWLQTGISDHTVGLELFKKYQPMIWEKHYKLPDSTGLDAGPFAITPEELKEVM